jgi:hypothetical protein
MHRRDSWRARNRVRVNENFQVRNYLFDSRVQSTRDYSELVFDGRASSIGAALRTLADQQARRLRAQLEGLAVSAPNAKLVQALIAAGAGAMLAVQIINHDRSSHRRT